MLVVAPEGSGRSQAPGESPLGGAARTTQQEGEGMGEGEGAEKVVPGVTELGEVVNLVVEPAGERVVVALGAQGGEGEIALASSGESLGVGPFPGGRPWLAPPWVDLAEGPLVADGKGAVAYFSAAVGEPAAEVEAAVALSVSLG